MTEPDSRKSDDERPLLDERTRDEYDEGWGERRPSADDDDRRYLEERPPHHGD